MEGEILFQLELDYLTTSFPSLAEKSIHIYYDYSKKKYMWIFNFEDIGEVVKILGKPVTFEEKEGEINKLISLCPPLEEKVVMDRWKGKGEYTFIEEPDIFVVGEWQKDPTTGRPKQAWIRIPKENVMVNWEIIKKYPANEWVKMRTQAEHVCRKLGFDKLFRESGTFDWSKFTGLHRKGHLPYVYYPIKILANIGVIEYSKVGKIKRVRETLTLQYQFTKPLSQEDIIKRKEEK